MQIITTRAQLCQALDAHRAQGATIGFVPTMGALHAGHLHLIDQSCSCNDITVASVFVNPIQFNNPSDLQAYPRTLEADAALLRQHRCAYLFAPSPEEMYPEPAAEQYQLGPLAEVMEGACRPGHFQGVAIVVKRLFDIVAPTRAYFGKKDFQQLAVIQHLTATLNWGVQIVPVETQRDADGLALSSRNARLSPQERNQALCISAALRMIASCGQTLPPAEIALKALEFINLHSSMRCEYVQIADAKTLLPIENWSGQGEKVACIAAFCGDVRLIDNIVLP